MAVETKDDPPRPRDGDATWTPGSLRLMDRRFCARVLKSLVAQDQPQERLPGRRRRAILDRPPS